MILLTGASGFVGSYLHKKLSMEEYTVKQLLLPKESSANEGSSEKIVYADITDRKSLEGAFKNVKTVIHLAGLVACNDSDKNQLINFIGTKNVVDECQKQGVERIVFSSAVASEYETPTAYGKSKKDAEDYILQSGLPYTIVRIPLVLGGGLEFDEFLKYITQFPIVPILGDGKSKKQPIYIDDVVDFFVSLLKNPRISGNKLYKIAGKSVVAFTDFIDESLSVLNIRKGKIFIPLFLCNAGAFILEKLLANPPVTREIIKGVQENACMDYSLAKNELGFDPLDLLEALEKCKKHMELVLR